MKTTTIITDIRDLRSICESILKLDSLALDLEFVRWDTYKPKLCLVQMGTYEENFIVDALKIDDLDCLRELLINESLQKVFHGSEQDLHVILECMNIKVKNLFDTQIANMFVNEGDYLSYSSLVKKICGFDLCKEIDFKTWSIRPLTSDQIEYAANDVNYLLFIKDFLEKKLEQAGKTTWMKEEMEIKTSKQVLIDPFDAWVKLKCPKEKITPLVRALAAWRENEAIMLNIPRAQVMSDREILYLSKLKGRCSSKGKKALEFAKDQINTNTFLTEFMDDESSVTEVGELTFDICMSFIEHRSRKYDISKRLTGNKKDLKNMLRNKENPIDGCNWRMQLFGKDIREIAAGRKAIFISNHKTGEIDSYT